MSYLGGWTEEGFQCCIIKSHFIGTYTAATEVAGPAQQRNGFRSWKGLSLQGYVPGSERRAGKGVARQAD